MKLDEKRVARSDAHEQVIAALERAGLLDEPSPAMLELARQDTLTDEQLNMLREVLSHGPSLGDIVDQQRGPKA